jgi:hypothetical protein
MKRCHPLYTLTFALIVPLAVRAGAPTNTPPAPPSIVQPATHDAYVREPVDREWHLYFSGKVPVYSWAGASLIVHNAAGRIVHREVVPQGLYPEDKPWVITIKPDGLTGDYRIVMVGHQLQFLGVCGTVSSDLPFESFPPSTNLTSVHFWKDVVK